MHSNITNKAQTQERRRSQKVNVTRKDKKRNEKKKSVTFWEIFCEAGEIPPSLKILYTLICLSKLRFNSSTLV